jgi:hypothetical protein
VVQLADDAPLIRGTYASARVSGARCAVRNSKLFDLHSTFGGDHLGSFFSDHDGGGVGISADHVGHDAGVRYAQICNAGNPELRIDYTADPTRAREVVHRDREMQREILQERIGWRCAFAAPVLGSELRRRQPRTEAPIGPMRRHIEEPAQYGYHHFHVVRIAKVIHADGGMDRRIGAFKYNFAFAVRQYRIGEENAAAPDRCGNFLPKAW